MNPGKGIALKIASVVVFVAMAACVKLAAPHVPAGETVFFRSVFAIPVILGWLAWCGHLGDGLGTRNPLGHLWRGLTGASAMVLSFTALGLLPLPEVTAIGYAAPLFVTVFAAMFLGETVRLYRLGAVALGLAGVTVVLAPRLSLAALAGGDPAAAVGAVAMLMAAVLMALAQVFIRKLVETEKTPAIVFYFSLTSVALSLFTVPFGWVVPDGRELLLLVAAGLLGGLAQILLTESYRHAAASVVAPFEYASMLVALAVGYLVFGEVPTLAMLGGAALVVSAGIVIILRERRLGIVRGKARPAMSQSG